MSLPVIFRVVFLITKQICILLAGFFICDFLGFLLLLKIKVKTCLLSSVSLLMNLVFKNFLLTVDISPRYLSKLAFLSSWFYKKI